MEKSIYERLQTARLLLADMEIKKGGKNEFAGYKYFELSDFLPTVQKLLMDQRLCPVVTFTAELATLSIVDMDKSGNMVNFTSPMAEANVKGCHPMQNMGAVETYQRRYLYMTAMEITEPDALDSSKPVEPKPESKPEKKYDDDDKPWITKKQVEQCIARILAGEQNVAQEARKHFKISRENWDKLVSVAQPSLNEDILSNEETPF